MRTYSGDYGGSLLNPTVVRDGVEHHCFPSPLVYGPRMRFDPEEFREELAEHETAIDEVAERILFTLRRENTVDMEDLAEPTPLVRWFDFMSSDVAVVFAEGFQGTPRTLFGMKARATCVARLGGRGIKQRLLRAPRPTEITVMVYTDRAVSLHAAGVVEAPGPAGGTVCSLRRKRLLCVEPLADDANSRSGACQSAMVTLAQLAMQMGCSVHVVGPDVTLSHAQPPWQGATLHAVLTDMAANTISGVHFAAVERVGPTDITFVFGDTPSPGVAGWRVCAKRWTGWIQPVEVDGPRWEGEFPIGGLGVAALAAAEAFKFAMRRLRPKGPRVEELAPATHARIRLGDESMPVPTSLGRVDCVGGGAITQGALHVLLRLPGLAGKVRVLEPQALEVTNCNR